MISPLHNENGKYVCMYIYIYHIYIYIYACILPIIIISSMCAINI